jgi:F-type H+-transporting ATPase subunit epsilon
VEGGFVEVRDDVVSLMTNQAIPVGMLNVDQAAKELENALRKPSDSPDNMEIRDEAVRQARAKLHLAKKNT